MNMKLNHQIINKFDVPGPRYTSYPTAPIWNNQFTSEKYSECLALFGATNKTLSLYVHIPFCEELCYFCACNMMIRRQDPKYGDEYLRYLFKEIDLVVQAIGRKPNVKQLHWGGGTPTFLNNDQIERLFEKINSHFDIDLNSEVAIEIDPRTIDYEKLTTLKKIGFNRVSMGVQDFNHDVQVAINRVQPLEMVERVYDWCRDLKFYSINFDLIYGLPKQTQDTFNQTIKHVCRLQPDRIALYSFAFLPWMRKHDSKFDQESLPTNDEKVSIFLNSRRDLIEVGYKAIAMDHFALEGDELTKAFNENQLYRNFMGYTVKPADEYIGIGVSAIGFIENAFAQNTKRINDYYRALENNTYPIERGLRMTQDDQIRQWVISELMCHFCINKEMFHKIFNYDFDKYFNEEKEHLITCYENGLIEFKDSSIFVTELGRLFIRNICMGFDWYLRQKNAHSNFSRTI